MGNRLQTPLTATIVIFVCSLVAAFITFRFLESTADYQATGIKVGGALAGLLITFIILWRSFHTLSQELGQTDRERLQEQVKNLQDQLVRQDPSPPGYHRVVNEDYKVVVHIPNDWVLGETNFMSIFAPSSRTQAGFMHNIFFSRKPAAWAYREIKLGENVNALAQKYATQNSDDSKLKQESAAQSPEYQQKAQELRWDFQLHRDDPKGNHENIADVLNLFLESIRGLLIGVPEHTEVNGFPAIRYQLPNPIFPNDVVNLVTNIHVNVGDEYIYTITLTAPPAAVDTASTEYNKVLNSLRFIT